MTDKMQLGLPAHVVDTILRKPGRWTSKGDLLKKQLEKLASKEDTTRILSGLSSGDICYFPMCYEYYAAHVESVITPSRYHDNLVYIDHVYGGVVLLRFLAVM